MGESHLSVERSQGAGQSARQMLSDLDAQKTAGTDSQSLAIEHARPHLVSVAQNLTQAITLVTENRDNINCKEYADGVGDIYAHADALHNKTDTILDYEEARCA